MQSHAGGKTKMSLQRRRYLRAMTTETSEPCYERFCLAYSSGTVWRSMPTARPCARSA
jgi:hypothetical protein